jgi:hypothetical protein
LEKDFSRALFNARLRSQLSKPPKLKELRTLPQRKAYAFLERKDPEQVMREAEEEAKFAAEMAPSREIHEAEKVAGDAVEQELLMESLGKPTPRKESEPRKAKQPLKCDHGRPKSQCKDCGTGHCVHGYKKSQCRDCGTGHCMHGRQKSRCKDCGTGHCVRRRREGRCKDCSA